ncbi:MAG: metalloregulator ArsR/SmtB family transcription factor [Candidatus Nanohaloarchaea archaeon]|nr:metalloregulator ArsR/SmtB family transcription factor [Candidatus Nanohaloarchaea archaeon]
MMPGSDVEQHQRERFAMRPKHERFLKTLANGTRFAIVLALRDGPKNVTELTEAVGKDQTTVSQNLKRLLECGFVERRKDGKQRIYSLNEETIDPLLELIDRHTDRYCSALCDGGSRDT